MINFDDYTNENKTEHNPNGHIFLIIHTERLLFKALDREKRIHY